MRQSSDLVNNNDGRDQDAETRSQHALHQNDLVENPAVMATAVNLVPFQTIADQPAAL